MAQNLTYTKCGDYYIPDIRLAHIDAHTLGKYAGCVEPSWSRTIPYFSMIWF